MGYGSVVISKIVNESNNSVLFTNPRWAEQGEIPPGSSNGDTCKGQIPTYDSEARYLITYYNQNLKKQVEVQVKDLASGSWLISFQHDAKLEHTVELRPQSSASESHFQVTCKPDGLEIYDLDANVVKGALLVYA